MAYMCIRGAYECDACGACREEDIIEEEHDDEEEE